METSTQPSQLDGIKTRFDERKFAKADFNGIAEFVLQESDYNRALSNQILINIVVTLGIKTVAEVAKIVAQKTSQHEQIATQQGVMQQGTRGKIEITMK